jgi:NADPH:quinone reductase-like Zn-dependent oxidoreductase
MTIPKTMHALLQKHDGYSGTQTGIVFDTMQPYIELAEIAVPDMRDGQVLIRTRLANINPSDLHFIKGEYGQPRRKGLPAGFEGVGDVIAGHGRYAESLVGKRVAFSVSMDGSGSWADYALTAAHNCIPIRPDMQDVDAAGHIVNPLTASAMFEIVRKAEAKSFILTAGASQVSKLVTSLARDTGFRAIVFVRRREMIEPLKALGAAHVLVESDPDVLDQFRAICKVEKPRVMLDAVANQLSADIFFAMPNRANWVIYGKLDASAISARDLGQFIFMSKSITGFWLTEWFRDTSAEEQIRVIGEVQARFVDRRWTTDVAEIIPLKNAIEKLPAALAARAGKVLLSP